MLLKIRPELCFDIIQCQKCGAWLDEYEWDVHACNIPVGEEIASRDEEKAPEIIARNLKKKN